MNSFLVFPAPATPDAVRAALGDAGAPAAPDAGNGATKIGEGIVEGEKRFFVYGDHEGVLAAAKRLAALAPKRLCGPAVVDRDL